MASDKTTLILDSLTAGDEGAAERLLPLVYDELHRLAARYMRNERADHTMQPTALINEAFLRLVDVDSQGLQNRAHFVRIAARAMRFVLVDHARSKKSQKRGGNNNKVTMSDDLVSVVEDATQVLAVEESLSRLGEFDAKLSELVELRFFGGLSNPEIASTLETSLRSVERNWRIARLWLAKDMLQEEDSQQG